MLAPMSIESSFPRLNIRDESASVEREAESPKEGSWNVEKPAGCASELNESPKRKKRAEAGAKSLKSEGKRERKNFFINISTLYAHK